VERWLRAWWSPMEISQRLCLEHPDDPMMRVSHETIYKTLFVQGRGELCRELTRCLRSGRTQRRPRSRIETPGRIPDMVMSVSGRLRSRTEPFRGTGRVTSCATRRCLTVR
jgi:IS30 family transposase